MTRGAAGRTWAIVLAGGDGRRLRGLTRTITGEERPKQFVALTGGRSLLGDTLARVRLLVPPERTVIVAQRAHAAWLEDEPLVAGATVLLQAANRGTAVGVLLPALRVLAQDPGATLAVFPSDHFIADAPAFATHVHHVRTFARRHPKTVVLAGAPATAPESEYGWIQPGETIGDGGGEAIRRVHRFCEKPAPATAATLLAAGWLWNTFVFVGGAATIAAAIRRRLPALDTAIARVGPAVVAGIADAAAERMFLDLEPADFSRDVLEPGAAALAVSTLPEVGWCDLGTPRRVFEVIEARRLRPPWLTDRTAAELRSA